MTADDVVLVSMFGTEGHFETEFTSWLAKRMPEDAARELLALAATEPARVRMAAVSIVSRLDAAAEPAWREVLDHPALRYYAEGALHALLAQRDSESVVPAGLKPEIRRAAYKAASRRSSRR